MVDATSARDRGPTLRFERAEFEGARGDGVASGTACKVCQQPIADGYYEINGHVTCAGCHAQVMAARKAGSGLGRLVRAAVLGTLAGIVGFALYYGVEKLTGYEFGLIAIVVGFMVGKAVQIGARQRGGWAYQLLAVAITYVSIASTYVPTLIEQIRQRDAAHPEASASRDSARGSAGAQAPAPDPGAAAPAGERAPAAAESRAVRTPMGSLEVAGVLLWLVGFALALPFLAGFRNIIGLLIIGFGLYQAWKLNQSRPFEATGPHAVARAAGP